MSLIRRSFKTVVLVLMAITIIVLALVNVWYLAKVDSLQQQVSNLTAENSNLQNKVDSLGNDNYLLHWQLNQSASDLAQTLNLTQHYHIISVGIEIMNPGQGENFTYSAGHAGYISIWVFIWNLDNASSVDVSLRYTFASESFNSTKTYLADPLNHDVDHAPALLAPVLPSNVTITIGNTNTVLDPHYSFGVDYYY
jgi:outer membrane murein-binding lipoprotein Lpp